MHNHITSHNGLCRKQMFTLRARNYMKDSRLKVEDWNLTNRNRRGRFKFDWSEMKLLDWSISAWLIKSRWIDWSISRSILQCILWYKLHAFFCWHRYRLFLYLFYFYCSYYCNTHTLARTRNISQGTSDNLRGKIFRNKSKLKVIFLFIFF